MRLMFKYGDVVRVKIGPLVTHLFNHPDYIRDVLIHNAKKYEKLPQERQALVALVGDGLIGSEGELWHHHRQLMQPLFNVQHLEQYGHIITDLAAASLQQWHARVAGEETLEVNGEMTRLALALVTRCLFGVEFADSDAMINAVETGVEYINDSFNAILPVSINVPANR